ncbi:MAG: undecaprenyl-diphosphate phosphatase [Thermoplasmata archaeon]
MDWLTAVVLGIIQGITEWLPISSSGHFIVAQHLLGEEIPFSFNIGLHFATMLVLIIFFRREILGVLKALKEIFLDVAHGISVKKAVTVKPERKYPALVLISVIPTGVIGLIVDLYIIDLYIKTLLPVGIAFIIQGFLNLSTKFGKEWKERGEIGLKDALAIGTMQGLATFSGLSRSGSTIATGVARGIRREEAARFSFLISLPAFIGAAIIESREMAGIGGTIDLQLMLIGGCTSFIVGLISLKLLMWVLRGKKFHLFSLYSFTFAAFVLFLYFLSL